MNATERRMALMRLLQEQDSIQVTAVAERFGVSGMTIRRDLNVFEKQGLVTITHGGAYFNRGVSGEAAFSVKARQNTGSKSRIAQAAAARIHEGEHILIDCGTTTLQLAKYIEPLHLTVITNSWPLAHTLGGNPRITLLLLPGVWDELSAGAFGESTIRFARDLRVDRAFLGTHGWSAAHGATVPTAGDAEVKRALLETARETYLLAEGAKYGDVCFARHADLSDFSEIFTDRLDARAQAELESANVPITQVES